VRDHVQISSRLDDIATLKPGWDGYSARPFHKATIAAASAVSHSLVMAGYDVSITPTSTETISIEWRQGSFECAAEVGGDGMHKGQDPPRRTGPSVTFVNRKLVLEGVVANRQDAEDLIDLVKRLQPLLRETETDQSK
jgi:hypothetical protein